MGGPGSLLQEDEMDGKPGASERLKRRVTLLTRVGGFPLYSYRQAKTLFKNAVKETKKVAQKGKIHRITGRRGEGRVR